MNKNKKTFIYDYRQPEVYPVWSDKYKMVVVEIGEQSIFLNQQLQKKFFVELSDSYILFGSDLKKSRRPKATAVLGQESRSKDFLAYFEPFSHSRIESYLKCAHQIGRYESWFLCAMSDKSLLNAINVHHAHPYFLDIVLSHLNSLRAFIELDFDCNRLSLFSIRESDFDHVHEFVKENIDG